MSSVTAAIVLCLFGTISYCSTQLQHNMTGLSEVEEDDEDMLEAGEDYQAIINIPFKMLSGSLYGRSECIFTALDYSSIHLLVLALKKLKGCTKICHFGTNWKKFVCMQNNISPIVNKSLNNEFS